MDWYSGITSKSIRLLFACLSLVLFEGGLQAQESDLGEGIYNRGLGEQSREIKAISQYDVPLPAQAAACVSCHRQSGLGVSEGYVSRSLNINGSALFSTSNAQSERPAYTRETLRQTLLRGIDSNGRTLDPIMPRYALSDKEFDALIDHLNTMSKNVSIGVTNNHIKLVTIISEDADAKRLNTLKQVIDRFVELKNANTRGELKRRSASNRHFFGRNKQRAYRKWSHSYWVLHGKKRTWSRQLEKYYANEAPFAALSGLTSDWQPVAEFCESNKLPCLLPINSETSSDKYFYSLFFETSVQTNIQAQLDYIYNNNPEARALIILPKSSKQLANAFANNLRATKLLVMDDPSAKQWKRVIQRYAITDLVSLVNVKNLPTSLRIPIKLYTEETSTPLEQVLARASDPSISYKHLYPYRLPNNSTQFPREAAWLQAQNLEHLHAITAGQVLFAAHAIGESISDMQTQFSKPYLLETLEHALDGTSMTTLYPQTTLGPNQRILVRSTHMLHIGANLAGQLTLRSVERLRLRP